MKKLISLAGFLCLIAMFLPGCAPAPEPETEPATEPVFDQAAEEAAIRDFVKNHYAALNAHDWETVFANTDENVEDFAGTRKGKAANEEYYGEIFETRFKDAQWEQYEELSIHFITPDVALYKDRYNFTGALDAEGNTRPPSKWSNAWVLVKRNGKWLMAEIAQWVIPE